MALKNFHQNFNRGNSEFYRKRILSSTKTSHLQNFSIGFFSGLFHKNFNRKIQTGKIRL